MHYPLYNDDGDLETRTEELLVQLVTGAVMATGTKSDQVIMAGKMYEVNPLGNGQCYKGFYCKAASTTPRQYPCGHANVFCPTGSGSPTPVNRGYYTSIGWKYISEVDVINQTVPKNSCTIFKTRKHVN